MRENCDFDAMKIAVIGQSAFGLEVYKLLRKNGHEIVGVFTVPDKGTREDPLGMPETEMISTSPY